MMRTSMKTAASLLVVFAAAGRVSAFKIDNVPVPVSEAEKLSQGLLYGRPNTVTVVHPSQTQPDSIIMLLHGRCGSSADIERDIPITRLVDQFNAAVFIPEATRNSGFCPSCGGPVWGGYYGCRAWAATPECCAAGRDHSNTTTTSEITMEEAFEESTMTPHSHADSHHEEWNPVDDSAYLMEALAAVQEMFPDADPRRVYVAGHSAGGFMAHRMACDHPDTFAAAVSVGGAMFNDPSLCRAFVAPSPRSPVHILQIHGSDDTVVPFTGGPAYSHGSAPVPGAVQTTMMWAQHNDCQVVVKAVVEKHDFLQEERLLAPPANDTGVIQYNDNCAPGGSAELWIIPTMKHTIPSNFKKTEFATALMQYFEGHVAGAAAPVDAVETQTDSTNATEEIAAPVDTDAVDAEMTNDVNDGLYPDVGSSTSGSDVADEDDEYYYDEDDENMPMAVAFAGPPDDSVGGVVCAADVRECSDGSVVSRAPPKCKFAKCPKKEKPSEATVVPEATASVTSPRSLGPNDPAAVAPAEADSSATGAPRSLGPSEPAVAPAADVVVTAGDDEAEEDDVDVEKVVGSTIQPESEENRARMEDPAIAPAIDQEKTAAKKSSTSPASSAITLMPLLLLAVL